MFLGARDEIPAVNIILLPRGYSQSTDYQRCIERRGRLVVLYCG